MLSSESVETQTQTERYLKVASGDLAFTEEGLPSLGGHVARPTVLLLHGNSNDKSMFFSLTRTLVLEGYHCVALDLLGHGNSSYAKKEENYSYSGQAQAVAEFLDEKKLVDVTILGLSLGGHIAYELLSHDRVKSIITLGAPPIAKVHHEGKQTYDFPNWFTFVSAQNEASEFNIMTLMSQNKFTEEEAQFWIQSAGITENTPEYNVQLAAALVTAPDARPALFNACMSGIGKDHNQEIRDTEKPVCLMYGERDWIDSKKTAEFAEQAGEHVTHHVLMNAPHYALYGASSEDFSKVLLETLMTQQAASLLRKGW